MFEHSCEIRVRYAETDQMKYVYYGNYAQYYEVGRVEAMRHLGLSYAEMESKYGIMMPVMEINMVYLRPAFYDDLLTLQTTIPELPGKEIVFKSSIYNPRKKIVNQGTVKLCFVDSTTNKRVSVPEFMLEALRPFYE